MIRFIVVGALAFVVGLGGSTGALVLTAPSSPAGADSTRAVHADSAATHSAPAAAPSLHAPATTAPAIAAPESASTPASRPAPAGIATSNSVAGHGPGAAPVVNVVPPPGRGPEPPDADSYKQVGNILLNMKPPEAAKIVGYLNDDQVEGLLRSMAPRQAASVLGQIPPERAAALSRRLLHPLKEARP